MNFDFWSLFPCLVGNAKKYETQFNRSNVILLITLDIPNYKSMIYGHFYHI